ncbi:MAG: HD-GYP domain-containing protein [Lachnospiraceae bacterium]|nr:HD-GYP domain-containing protein [Lachnospiraceae bacterium]
MVKLEVKKLKPGMVVEKPIVTKRGQTIAKVGTVLDSKLIARLNFYKITEVTVDSAVVGEGPKTTEQEEVKEAPKPEPVEEPKEEPPAPPKKEATPKIRESMSYTSKLQSDKEFQDFQISYSANMATLEDTFDTIIFGDGNISETELIKKAESMFASKTSIQLFDLLHCMKSIDDSVYAHSINVALISRAIGKWLKLPREELDELTIAGLLHDIGKAEIPDEILNKTEKLTDEEFELIKSHALRGSKLLKKAGFNSDIQFAALQHHERSDGSGYPRGLEEDEISDFASIIAIADVYDAMTSARSYRKPKCAFQVIAAFEDEGLQKFNTKYILTFLERIANAYQNSMVILSDGRRGKVVYINKNKLSRPIVQVDDDEMIDLSRESGLTITSVM